MAYYLIGDFRGGLDARRLSESAVTGTVRELSGGFVNSGGEIEKLQGFIEDAGLSEGLAEASARGGWVGPVRTATGEFLFAGVSPRPSALPGTVGGVTVLWSQLDPAGVELKGLAGHDVFGADVYLACEFGDGVHHYYGTPGSTLSEVLDAENDPLPEPHVKTIASKVFRGAGNLLSYSAVLDPAVVDADNGGGFIDVTTAEGAIGPIRGLGMFRNRLAVFGRSGVQIWTVDEDPSPAKTFLYEVVGGMNVLSGKSVATYDNGDILFLSPSGVRSLRTQNLSANAARDDVGTPVDDLVQEAILTGRTSLGGRANLVGRSLADASAPPASEIMSVVEPVTGQFWLLVGGVVFILSRFQQASVRAWSTAELPDALLGAGAGHIRGAAASADRLLLCTQNDKGYLYGGGSGLEYDQNPLTVVTPFQSAEEPATEKTYHGVDLVASGRWIVEAAFDPAHPEAFEHVATVEGTTTRLHQLPLRGRSTHVSFRLTSTDNSTVAKLSQLAVHFSSGRKA